MCAEYAEDVIVEWDEGKRLSNCHKRGVSFDAQTSVFSDVSTLLIDDPDHSVAEERFALLGCWSPARILVLAHCLRCGGTAVPVIFARRVTDNEAGQYLARRRKGSEPEALRV